MGTILQPEKLRSQLLRLAAASVCVFLLFAAAAAWIAFGQPIASLEDPRVWLAASSLLIAIALPLHLAQTEARKLALAVAALEEIAKALIGNAEAKVPSCVRVRELEQAAEKLVHAAGVVRGREFALRSADRVKDEFLAMLAHELRNPLAAVTAAGYLLRKTAKEPVTLQSGEIIERQTQQMARLVEDLLDVARISRGKVSLSRQPLDLAKAVEKAVEEMRLAGRLAQHALHIEADEAWVRADEARLQQMITNLLGNAVKYTPAGGRIAITVRRERDEAILRVLDSGVGMSPELAARVFDLFVQGEASRRRGGGGLGIGLALVKHLAELHGGKAFAASSGPGEGSAFTVSLPAIEAQGGAEAPVAPAAPPQARHRILLVDDNADTRHTMFAALALQGHRVYEAADGQAGLRTFESVQPDVAVIDIGLPDLNGFEMASALDRNPARGDAVLIAMTGLERPDTLRRAREAGFDEYVTKPIAPDRLERLIDAAFVAKSSVRREKAPRALELGPRVALRP